MKKIIYVVAIILMLGVLAACAKDPEVPLTYTVTFDSGGGTLVEPQQVLNGSKVVKPTDPVREGFMFSGKWMFGTFEWNFSTDIVTDDMTLVATWIEISSTPTEIQMTDDSFSSVLQWMQTDADLQVFTVSIKTQSGAYQTLEGTFEIDTTLLLHVVKFTPDVLPQGGYYDVKIEAGLESAEATGLLFGGAGTETNPYAVTRVGDIIAILENEYFSDKHFKQLNDITSTLTNQIQINNARKIVFSGSYNGQNNLISFTGNGGLFHEITETGVVRNLVIDASTTLVGAELNLYPIGAVSDKNAGLIENISSRALLENARLQGNLPVYSGVNTTDHTTGAGGIVGRNSLTGIIRNVTVSGAGAVKAGRGVGGVAAYNFGLIEYSTVTATLPAGNQANSANSSNTYSYGGGIAGFNFGTIQYVAVTGRVFAQSAYAEAGAGNEGKNVGFGGIAGYNEGIIRNSSFARSLAAKEFISKTRAGELGDAANNLGVASVHGDLYVGGIAGINAGQISDVYVGGAIIGARDFAGGIAGLTLGSGSITNSYVFAEVAIKNTAGEKLTVADAKTTLTTYEIAPSGFDANTVFFRNLLNIQTNQTWTSGQLEAPKLPEFTAADLTKVGNQFAASGVLLWQQGSVTGVNIALDTVALPFDSTLQLEFNVSPSSAPDTFTTWTSSDPTIVKVIGEGLIEGVGVGTATITVTTRDGGFTDTVVVTVEDYVKITSVSITSPEITLPEANNADIRDDIEIGTVINLLVDILPADAKFKNYTVSLSNSRGTVNGNEVTFVSTGLISIYVDFEDSSIGANGRFNFRFTIVAPPAPPADVPITSVAITSPDVTLPEPNNADIRDDIEINSVINLVVDILPLDASNKNYTVSVSNSRGTVNGNEVTFITNGLISVIVTFEDTSVGVNGVFNFRFTVVTPPAPPADVPITSVAITSPDVTLPEANNTDIRDDIEIGTVINLLVDILPLDATNKNYTITTSNSRAVADNNQISFVYGLTGPGNVSVFVTFEDASIGNNGVFEYRFKTIEAPVVITATITSPEITLGQPNVVADKVLIPINTVVTFVATFSPEDPANTNFVITASNTRAVIDGNQVTFTIGAGSLGNVSLTFTFGDGSIATVIYYFTTTSE